MLGRGLRGRPFEITSSAAVACASANSELAPRRHLFVKQAVLGTIPIFDSPLLVINMTGRNR